MLGFHQRTLLGMRHNLEHHSLQAADTEANVRSINRTDLKPNEQIFVKLRGPQQQWPEQVSGCRLPPTNGSAFRLVRLLGDAVVRQVFLAEDGNGGQTAVRMFLSDEYRDDEARVLMRISSAAPRSQHLLTFQAGLHQQRECCGLPCIVSEFVDGTTLLDLLADHGTNLVEFGLALNAKLDLLRPDFNDRTPEALQKVKSWLPYTQLRDIIFQTLVAICDMETIGVCQHIRLNDVMLERGTGRLVFIDFLHASDLLGPPGQPCFSPDRRGFKALGYLLQNDTDAASFQRMISRWYKMRQPHACAALREEALRPLGSAAASDKLAFLRLHDDAAFQAQLLSVFQDSGSSQACPISLVWFVALSLMVASA